MQLCVKDYNIRLIDSLNFLQFPLSQFCESFGMDPETFCKGDFPFKFNTRENQNYIGSLPKIHFYSPDTKMEKERAKLIAWHGELTKNDYTFDFQKEMYRYCSQDVTILRLGCLIHDSSISETNVDPFTYCTIAASVMHGYLSIKISIAILPRNMYHGGNKPFS